MRKSGRTQRKGLSTVRSSVHKRLGEVSRMVFLGRLRSISVWNHVGGQLPESNAIRVNCGHFRAAAHTEAENTCGNVGRSKGLRDRN